MHVGRTGKYAIRTVLDLAETGGSTVESLSTRNGIPGAYLQRLIPSLAEAGIVRSKRGPGGGVVLGKEPSSISLLSILRAVGADNEDDDSAWLNVIPFPQRVRLESAERQLFEELELLTLADMLPLGRETTTTQDIRLLEMLPPRRLVDFIGRQAVTSTRANHCAIYFGGAAAGFYTTAFDNRERPIAGPSSTSMPLVQTWVPFIPVGVVAEAARVGHPILVSDVMTDTRPSREMAVRFNVRSVSAVPIHAGREGWGALIIAKQRPHRWSEKEVATEIELADIARLAIIGHSQSVAHHGLPAHEESH